MIDLGSISGLYERHELHAYSSASDNVTASCYPRLAMDAFGCNWPANEQEASS